VWNGARPRYFLISLIIVSPIFVSFLSLDNAFAAPPSFSRQEISGERNAWALNSLYCPFRPPVHVAPAPNIAAVSYFSDGQTLNATMMLSYPLHMISSNLEYMMVIE
jgi:hypothetical protein